MVFILANESSYQHRLSWRSWTTWCRDLPFNKCERLARQMPVWPDAISEKSLKICALQNFLHVYIGTVYQGLFAFFGRMSSTDGFRRGGLPHSKPTVELWWFVHQKNGIRHLITTQSVCLYPHLRFHNRNRTHICVRGVKSHGRGAGLSKRWQMPWCWDPSSYECDCLLS